MDAPNFIKSNVLHNSGEHLPRNQSFQFSKENVYHWNNNTILEQQQTVLAVLSQSSTSTKWILFPGEGKEMTQKVMYMYEQPTWSLHSWGVYRQIIICQIFIIKNDVGNSDQTNNLVEPVKTCSKAYNILNKLN